MEHVHCIRIDFQVTPQVKRYVNVYLIVGKTCVLIDTGVKGSDILISKYLESLGKSICDIETIFLTHSHPDHMGATLDIQKQSGCKIYGPLLEKEWIENIDQQFGDRPIPNFYSLLQDSVKLDGYFFGGEKIQVGEHEIEVISTPGHSHGHLSYLLDQRILFSGDAIPVFNDLPIFVDYQASIQSLETIETLNPSFVCPAWNPMYEKEEVQKVIHDGKALLENLREISESVWVSSSSVEEKIEEILRRTNLLPFKGNLLVVKSILACVKKENLIEK